MREILKLFLIVAIFSLLAGLALAAVRDFTAEDIEVQRLTYVIGPTIKEIFTGCTNDPITDRFKIADGKKQVDFFIGEFDGKKSTVAFESSGRGYGGDIGIMVAFNLEKDEVIGIGITTHKESPGLGSRAQTDPSFGAQFKGKPINMAFKVKPDGGEIDALSGATVTSRGVCSGVTGSLEMYKRFKEEILKKIKG